MLFLARFLVINLSSFSAETLQKDDHHGLVEKSLIFLEVGLLLLSPFQSFHALKRPLKKAYAYKSLA